MSLVINTNEQATRIHGVYNRNNTMMNSAMTRVATAQKINSARDGAANWAISEKMRERIRANDQANQNVQNDTALLKTAQGGIDNTIDILKTLKERAINAANDSNINTDRAAIATEVFQLVNQIDDNAAKVKFNGRTLLDGSLGSQESTGSNGVTATNPKGSSAIYRLDPTTLKTGGSSPAAATDETLLVSLADANDTTKRLFNVGDVITLNWKENGVSASKEITVAAGTKVSDLDFSDGSLESSGWVATNTAITDSAGNNIKKADGNDYKTTAAGVYFAGAEEVKITDMSLSVTYQSDGVTKHRTEAEEALKIEAVQQTWGPAKGSSIVYASDLSATSSALSFANGGNTLENLQTGTTKIFSSIGDDGKVTFKFGDKSVTVGSNATIADLNAAFENANINVRAQYATKGQEIKYEGNPVTRGSGADASNFTATEKGLFFVGAPGENIGTMTVTAAQADGTVVNPNAKLTAGGTVLSLIGNSSSSSSTTSNNALPSYNMGGALTFHVGGEADFYMDIGIKAMTTSSLLGNSAQGFAAMFTDKTSARNAVSTIDNAIQAALNEQTRLGAIETRLGYTSDNIITMNENLEAADSAYRDADIAKEMTNYMKYAVLSQSAQYMLAQAGQNGYQVLNLLNA